MFSKMMAVDQVQVIICTGESYRSQCLLPRVLRGTENRQKTQELRMWATRYEANKLWIFVNLLMYRPVLQRRNTDFDQFI